MPQKKRKGLGKGLSALLGESPVSDRREQTLEILIAKIKPNKYQPRTNFGQEELASLTESIRRDGVLMPILVRPVDGGYELIAGERRWRASQAAKLLKIPAVVRDVDDLQALELAIIENVQRADLTAVESARAYRRLMDEFGYTQQQIAENIGVSRVQVSNLIRLLQLPDSIQQMLEQRVLKMGQARPLVGIEASIALNLAKQCIEKSWSARQMEKEAKKALSKDTPKPTVVDADITALEEDLTRTLGVAVQLMKKKNGAGELKIAYSHKAELDAVLQRLRQGK